MPAIVRQEQYLRTGEVAKKAGVNIQTLRYYERRGLIDKPQRSIGGHRAYSPEVVTLLGVIKAAQRLGFTLDEVAELLSTGHRGHPTPGLQHQAQVKLAEIDRKISDLMTIKSSLENVVAAQCPSLTECRCTEVSLPFAELAT